MARRRFPQVAVLLLALATGIGRSQLAHAQKGFDEAALDAAVEAAVQDAPIRPSDVYLQEVMPVSHSTCSVDSCAAPACNRGDRWYLGLSGGWQERETVHEVGDPLTFIVFDSGFLVNAQMGYRFDLFRLEAEYSFMNNDVQRAGFGGLDTPAAGNVNLKAFMGNVYHDFQLFDWLWQPYVGAGIGVYQSELNSLYPDFFAGAGGAFATTPVNTTSNMPLAYQFRAGVSRPVGQRSEVVLGYRYFRGEELEFSSAPFASPVNPTFHPDGAKVHNLEVGLRVRF